MALGATGGAIRRLMLGRVGLLCGLGLIAGGLIILWSGQFVRSLLFGVDPWDFTSILGSAIALIMVGLSAAWLPARRASRLEPAVVLRES
jgi:ABC-type antimicrobial peptide transport system permease subunit